MKALVVALLATLAVQASMAMAVFTPAILVPSAHGDIGVAASAIGIFTALIYALASLSALIGGTFVARFGAVRVSQACLALGGTGLAACGLTHPAAVIAGAVLIGMGYGATTPASSVLLIAHTPDRVRNLIMSVRQTGVPVGGALAGAVVPWLALNSGWRTTAVVIGAIILVLALMLQMVRGTYDHVSPHPPSQRPTLASLLAMVFGHAELRRVSFAAFAYAGMQLCFVSYVVVFLTERAGLPVVNAGAALSAAMLAGIAGRVLWGVAADYLGNARLVLAMLGLAMTVCAVLLSLVNGGWPFSAILLLCVAYGATAVGWNGVYIAEVARVAPEGKVAIATGASLAFTYFGVVICPLCFWLIVAVTGSYAIAFGLAALLTCAAAVSILHRVPAPV